MSKRKWYCYVCGEKLKKKYCLVSMNDSTDRVFLSHEKCARQFDDAIIVKINETP